MENRVALNYFFRACLNTKEIFYVDVDIVSCVTEKGASIRPTLERRVVKVSCCKSCLRVTSASSALGVLDDYALYKSTHSLTHSLVKDAPVTLLSQHQRPSKFSLIPARCDDADEQ